MFTPPLRIRRRTEPRGAIWSRIGAIILGLTVGALIVSFGAKTSGNVYGQVWGSTFGSGQGVSNVLTTAATLILTGLAASIPLRMRLWNIGGEGQLFMGAWAGAGVSFALNKSSGFLLIPLMILFAAGAGAAWVLIPALVRAYIGVNEIISTLLLNFVAVLWLAYWVTGPWAEPVSQGGIKSRLIPNQADLSLIKIGNASVHWGFVLAIALAVIAWLLFRSTKLGYEASMLVSGLGAGRYAGISVRKQMVVVLLLGGAMAGIAGAVEMMGNIHRYSDSLSNNTGYSGIVVAVLAGGSELMVVPMAVLFAALITAGNALQTTGISSNTAFALMGFTLLFAAIGDSLSHYRIVRRTASNGADVRVLDQVDAEPTETAVGS